VLINDDLKMNMKACHPESPIEIKWR